MAYGMISPTIVARDVSTGVVLSEARVIATTQDESAGDDPARRVRRLAPVAMS